MTTIDPKEFTGLACGGDEPARIYCVTFAYSETVWRHRYDFRLPPAHYNPDPRFGLRVPPRLTLMDLAMWCEP